jgi:NAD(P)-dependent dehydrogenase (short-subunit alcohol dehydrogenase family)
VMGQSESRGDGLAGKVVLVTGAGKGKGRAAAETFAAHQALLAVNDVSPVNLDETVAHILAAGGRVKMYIEDIAKKMPVQTLIHQVLEDFGRIDILINCAEVEPAQPVLEMDDWDWQRTLDVNLSGPFLLIQSVGMVMKEEGGGIIIHLQGKARETTGRAAYLASRAGAAALVETAAAELAAAGIHVHQVQTAEEALEVCIP